MIIVAIASAPFVLEDFAISCRPRTEYDIAERLAIVAECAREERPSMGVELRVEGPVGVVVLNRPPANSYDYAFLRELGAAIDDVRYDDRVRAVVVTSASDRFFSAGADVAAFRAGSANQRAMTALLAHEVFRKLEHTPMVFVAAISGHALGGGLELALACDL